MHGGADAKMNGTFVQPGQPTTLRTVLFEAVPSIYFNGSYQTTTNRTRDTTKALKGAIRVGEGN